MNYHKMLTDALYLIERTDPNLAPAFSLCWRESMELLPTDQTDILYSNEFSIITKTDIQHGIPPKKWETIKSRIGTYCKEGKK